MAGPDMGEEPQDDEDQGDVGVNQAPVDQDLNSDDDE